MNCGMHNRSIIQIKNSVADKKAVSQFVIQPTIFMVYLLKAISSNLSALTGFEK